MILEMLTSSLLIIILVMVFVVLGSIFTPHPFYVRYAILSFPPFILFLTCGITWNRLKKYLTIILVLMSCIFIFSLRNYYFDEKYQRENVRAAGQYLIENVQENDFVIACVTYTKIYLKYYCKGKLKINIKGYPDVTQNDGKSTSAKGAQFVNINNLESDLNTTLTEKERFWLFLSRIYHSDPYGNIRKYCDDNYYLEKTQKWNDAELILYRIR
jgi:hypothetical protein